MIDCGEYKIIQVLNISESLDSQIINDNKPSSKSIYKCLATKNNKNFVIYFVEDFDLGQNSIIEVVKENKISSLIYKSDYKIISKKPFIFNKNFLLNLQNISS